MVIQVYIPTTNVKETEQFYEDLQDLLKLKPKNDILFIIGDWNAKVVSQETLGGVTGKFGLGVQNEAGKRPTVLSKECSTHSKHPLPTTWDNSTHGRHQMVNTEIRLIYIFCSRSWRSSIRWAKTRPGAEIMNYLLQNSDLNWRKVGKTTTPFRYDRNQIPYTYTVEVTNRFKGLDLIECLKNYGWRFVTLHRRRWSKPSPRKRNAKRQMVV